MVVQGQGAGRDVEIAIKESTSGSGSSSGSGRAAAKKSYLISLFLLLCHSTNHQPDQPQPPVHNRATSTLLGRPAIRPI